MKQLRITVEGKTYEVLVEEVGQESAAPAAAAPIRAAAAAPIRAAAAPAAPKASAGAGDVPSPLSGKVVSIDCKQGQTIKAGDQIMTLEAMKMNTFVNAPSDGTVQEILVAVGDGVDEGQPLVKIG